MSKLTDLPIITNSSITDNHVFVVATNSTTDQLSLNELQKSFTGLTARTTDGISILGNTIPSGITVGDNGYVGIDKTNPTVALDIGDIGSATLAEARLSSRAASRQASYTLTDSSVWWRTSKKATDTDFYIETSTNGSSFTGVFNIDVSGNVGIFDGSSSLSDKFYVSGGTVKFQSGVSGIQFDPGGAEIKTTVNGDIFYINKSNNDDIVLGNNVFYVDNDTIPKVGLFTTSPSFPFHVKNSGIMASFDNTSSVSSNIKINNTANSGYINLIDNTFSFGAFSSSSTSNLCYNINSKYLGLGTTDPSNKLHIYSSTDQTLAYFDGASGSLAQMYQMNSYSSGPASGPWHTLYTFGRHVPSIGPTARWGIGLCKNNNFDDSFVFRVNGNVASDNAVKLEVTTNGDINAQGSYTTDDNYCKGKFVQVYQTRVTGNCIYFNPFFPNSNTNPSGHNDLSAPFGLCPYSGKIEKIMLFSSDSALVNLSDWRFEIVKNDLQPSSIGGFVSGFFPSPSSSPTSFPTSGIIADFNIQTLTGNQILTATLNQMSGSPVFSSGDLLQYRIVGPNGTKNYDIDFSVVSSISFTVV
jgi:hypothetical protein